MTTRKFWPLDFDPEGEIYDNPAWDLPGFKRGLIARLPKPSRGTRKTRRR
jgi:hypothetical protein